MSLRDFISKQWIDVIDWTEPEDMPNPEEALAKAELANKITVLIEDRGLTQVQTAKLLGIDQPKVSALIRGRLSGFSLERLMRFLLMLSSLAVCTWVSPLSSMSTVILWASSALASASSGFGRPRSAETFPLLTV